MSLQYSLQFSADRLSRLLPVIVLLLCLMHLVVMLLHYQVTEIDWLIRGMFDLDEEQSFGTWFSSISLLLAALILLQHAKNLDLAQQPMVVAWRILGFGFCLLSIDEVVGMHESLNTAIEMSWAIPGAVIAALVGIIYIPFLLHLPVKTRWLFILSGALYIGGAVGVELLTEPFEEEDLLDTLAYNLTTLVEEGLEMSGVVLFIRTLLLRVTVHTG
jgi:hypothetical protein